MQTANEMAGMENLTKADVAEYERTVLLELEFSMHFVSPLDFLDRFTRIFEMDISSAHNT